MNAKNNKPLALVIGGSLGGLCAGVCLRAAGWRVSIFERSPGLMDDRGAGIVLQSEVLNLLEGLKLTTRAEISVESGERQYLNQDGSVASSGFSRQFMTSWGALFNSLRRGFPDKFTFYHMPRSHILCYAIPGTDGSVTEGKRRLNWVWYWNYREADELPALLTDRTGRKRRTSVPPGMVCPEHWQKQMEIARAFLPPQFRGLLEATREPFAQPIRDLAVPQMVFGRSVLVGEAAFVLRPHTAAAAAKAAADGMVLGEALRDGDDNFTESLQRFEAPQMEMGLNLRNYGIRAGNQSQFPRGSYTAKE